MIIGSHDILDYGTLPIQNNQSWFIFYSNKYT
jgi:hypothetical protein